MGDAVIRRCDNGHAPLRLESGQRCPACARRREARRATPSQRGYGAAHQRARQALASLLPAPCGGDIGSPYCGRLVHADERWVAAHRVDGDASQGYVPAHGACNERAKGTGGRLESGRVAAAIPAPRSLAPHTGLDASRARGGR